jgi:hypothetical protein
LDQLPPETKAFFQAVISESLIEYVNAELSERLVELLYKDVARVDLALERDQDYSPALWKATVAPPCMCPLGTAG